MTGTFMPASAEWLIIRDQIRVNAELKGDIMAEIKFRKISPGTPLGLIAREIVHDQFYTLRIEGFPLVLVADFYNGNQGWIDTSGSSGATYPAGGTGLPGYATQTESRPGKRGPDGKPGEKGRPASAITLIAGTIQNAQLSALGGPGGAGANGGSGGRGANGKKGQPGKFNAIPPTDGGPGGNGGNGANGGRGALITVHYVIQKGQLTTIATGGAGGAKGQAGAGGKAGRGGGPEGVALNGAAGKPGVAGAAGNSGTPVKTKQHAGKWDLAALAALGKAVDKWAAYRARVGEYAFRRHTAKAPKDGDIELRAFARSEFLAAQRLARETARADQLLQYLESNLTPLGVPYNYDVMPDFSHFEQVLTDYGPWVQILFSDSQLLLLETTNTDDKKKRLDIDLSYIEGMQEVLQLELNAKIHEGEIVQMQVGHTKGNLSANQKAIQLNLEEQAKERIEAADDYFYGTVAQVAAVVVALAAAIETLGASAALLAPAGLLAKADTEWHKGGLGNLIDWSKKDPELKPEFKDLAGGLKELVDGTKNLIDKYKTTRDLFEAKVNGALQSKAKDLLIRHLDLTYEISLLGLKQKQVLLEAAAIKQEGKATDENQKLVSQFRNDVQENVQALGRISQALIRQAQSYADILIKYTFYATRAFDLWTFQDETSSFAFDFGQLHPDAVERAFQATARGDGSRVMKLLEQYLPSWSKLPDLLKLRDKYEDYSTGLVTETFFWSYTGRALPISFKQQHTATFHTKMPNGRYEAKILNVAVALVGATADDPSVTVIVEHTGESTVRHRNGQTTKLQQPPRREPISATFDANDLEGLDEVERVQFWGRSPEATWRVSIDSESAQNSKLNLTKLKELQFTIYYKCFFAS